MEFSENTEDQVAQLRSAVLSSARTLLEGIKSNIKWQIDISVVFAKAANPNIVTEKPIFFSDRASDVNFWRSFGAST